MGRSDSETKSRGSDSKGKEICTEDQLPKEIKEESCNSCEPTKLDFSACVKELEGMIKQKNGCWKLQMCYLSLSTDFLGTRWMPIKIIICCPQPQLVHPFSSYLTAQSPNQCTFFPSLLLPKSQPIWLELLSFLWWSAGLLVKIGKSKEELHTWASGTQSCTGNSCLHFQIASST